MDSTKIGNYIAKLRKAHGWTQSDLATRLSVSDKTISKWESGNGLPDIAVIPDIAKIFGISTDELFAGESKKSSPNESIFGKIASGDLDFIEEIGKGLNVDKFDEYGKSLADYCAEKNNIDVFRLLIKLDKVYFANRSETRSNMNMQPGGKETITYEDVIIYDCTYHIGNRINIFPKDYSDSALFCLLVKNRADDLLQKVKMEVRAFNNAEADCITEDFEYYYKKYFIKAFPTHIGIILRTLVQKGKIKDAQKLLNLIVDHRNKMEQKRLDCERETQSRGYRWTINWNTGYIREPVYDKNLNKEIVMRDKIIAGVWGVNVRPYIIGNAIIVTQEDIVEIGFVNPEFLVACKMIGIEPKIDEPVILRLLEKNDIKTFDAFISGVELSKDLERLILNSDGKIKAHYIKLNIPKDFNDVLASGDVKLALSLLSKPKEIALKLKDLKIELLGGEKMFPVLKKFIPFMGQDVIDKLLKDIVPKENTESRIALLEAGAKVHVWQNDTYGYGGHWVRDDTQTEILYKLLKSEVK